MLNEPSYDLNRLALYGEVTPRIVRFYIRQGLLPSPGAQDRSPRFTQADLDRLRVIGELQREQLPIDEIRAHLEGSTAEDIRRQLETTPSARVAALVVESVRSMLAGVPTPARG